jgi:hypothetical protein
MAEDFALDIEHACPRLDVRTIDLELGLKTAATAATVGNLH